LSSPLDDLRAGGKRALARALNAIEAQAGDAGVTALLDAAYATPQGHVLGLTGPPGVGKSTLINALIRDLRGQGRTVAVIAIDPSSRASRGALLGDRTRFVTDPEDRGVYVRSMAARERLGGLSEITYPAMVLMRALYDVVIVETVGVGQSETDIADIADTVLLCAQPGSGDALQFMKAGVMEIPDLVVVTKADLGALARRAVADLKGALSLASVHGGAAAPPVLSCSATRGEGLGDLTEHLLARADAAADAARRQAQGAHWLTAHLGELFGREGVARLRQSGLLDGSDAPESPLLSPPFGRAAGLAERLRKAISATEL
jgi:LAO/AO transport system kinase